MIAVSLPIVKTKKWTHRRAMPHNLPELRGFLGRVVRPESYEMLVAIKTLRDLIQQVMADFEPIGRLGMARPAGCYPSFAISRHQAHLSFGSTLSL